MESLGRFAPFIIFRSTTAKDLDISDLEVYDSTLFQLQNNVPDSLTFNISRANYTRVITEQSEDIRGREILSGSGNFEHGAGGHGIAISGGRNSFDALVSYVFCLHQFTL